MKNSKTNTMIKFQFQDETLKKQFYTELKKKVMPDFIKEAQDNGYTGWQAEDKANDYYQFFLSMLEPNNLKKSAK